VDVAIGVFALFVSAFAAEAEHPVNVSIVAISTVVNFFI
jgi:hypothetical protein